MILYPFLAMLLCGGVALYFQLRAGKGDQEPAGAFGWLALLALVAMLLGILTRLVNWWLP